MTMWLAASRKGPGVHPAFPTRSGETRKAAANAVASRRLRVLKPWGAAVKGIWRLFTKNTAVANERIRTLAGKGSAR
jgi:hypothetical protein